MIEGQQGVTWDDWVALAGACEEHGLEGLFRSDHYLGISSEPAAAHDAWATLAALAAITDRIRLGTLVSPVTFRHPAVVARMVVTVDHISAGRVELGIGAGWYEAEHEANGFPFPPLGERFDKLEHDADAIVHAWTDDSTAQPKPVQRPHPPLIVGGSAKPRGARLAARLAQEYNTVYATLEQCRERRAALDDACRAVGRDPQSLPLTVMTRCAIGETRRPGDEGSLVGSVEEIAERLRALEAVGVHRVFLQHLDHRDLDAVAVIGRELVPAVR
jgi:alkanesulfonate monooxygenase SsuD/methylene tetrahydromethanopterin reductase-like flavin-dependent oxidoreductase (luciferase family)